jgi:hypothetical protein
MMFVNITDCLIYSYLAVELLGAVARLMEQVKYYLNEHKHECVLCSRHRRQPYKEIILRWWHDVCLECDFERHEQNVTVVLCAKRASNDH